MPEFTKEKLAELRAVAEAAEPMLVFGGPAQPTFVTMEKSDVLALIGALEAKTAEADYWQDSWNREDGYRIDAERERDKARAEVESITSQWRATGRAEADAHRRAEKAEAALERIKDARGNYPECDKYDDDSPVTCGWKRTVQSIDAALQAAEGAKQ